MLKPILLAALLAMALAAPASADSIHLSATLSGVNEVPPLTSPGSGEAVLVLDTETGFLNGKSMCAIWPRWPRCCISMASERWSRTPRSL